MVKNTIEKILEKMGIPHSGVEEKTADAFEKVPLFVIKTEDSGLLIGKNGETYRALQYLIKRIVLSKEPEHPSFFIDVNNYFERNVEQIKTKAAMMAGRARSFKTNIELEPMSSYERLVVHNHLAAEPNIRTESEGFGRNRRVVIKYTEE